MKGFNLVLYFSVLFIGLIISGCGGGGGGAAVAPVTVDTGTVSGRVVAEAGVVLARIDGVERVASASSANTKVYVFPASTNAKDLTPSTAVPNAQTDSDGNYTITKVPVGGSVLVVDYNSDGIADEREFNVQVSKDNATNVGTTEVAALNKDAKGSWCDIDLDKVNYAAGEDMVMTLNGFNYDSNAVKCGVKIVLQKGQDNGQKWASDFTSADTYISIPAGIAGSGIVRKTIPFSWEATNTSAGSNYKVYTIHEDGTIWGKYKDNFNITKSAVCFADSECDDSNGLTTDVCADPGTSGAACTHTPFTIACSADADCNDSNPLTLDTCAEPGTKNAVCGHTAIACNANTDCNDNNTGTIDVCNNPGATAAACLHNAVVCNTDTECNDSNTLTIDSCNNPGTASSACLHTSIACNADTDCNDSNNRTSDTCGNAGTTASSCAHTAITCLTNTDCDDSNAITVDTCNSAGTVASSCSHLGVTATAASSSITISGDDAQTTLTCSVTGTTTLLEARCGSTGAWTTIASGDTTTCSYTAAGSFTPECRVNGTTADTTDSPITVSEPPNQAPVAAASSDISSGKASLAVNFTGGCSDADGACASYNWDFGDGSPTSSAQNPNHIFTASGTYSVTLTVADNDGATTQQTVTITVAPPNQSPAGSITADIATGTAPLAVNFTGGCADTDGTCASYYWDFGDGSPTTSQQNPNHTFANDGTFTVTFTVTDDNGATDASTQTVRVYKLGKIVFASNRDGDKEIYIMDGNGSNVTKLTTNTVDDEWPGVSPDYSKIVFHSNLSGIYQLYTMNIDGTNRAILADGGTYQNLTPRYSPDGTQIVFSSDRDGHWEIYKMASNGTNQVKLTNCGAGVSCDIPQFSPDGTKILYRSNPYGDIFVMNADGTNNVNLTNSVELYRAAAFSPDGTKIAFLSLADGDREIYLMNADGSNKTQVTFNAADDVSPHFTSDGRIAYVSDRDGNSNIYIMDADGSNDIRLTNDASIDDAPFWIQ